MRLWAIDPGTAQSGIVGIVDGRVYQPAVLSNPDVLELLMNGPRVDAVVIERPQFFGAATRFTDQMCDTVIWIGKFMLAAELSGTPVHTPFRKTIVTHHTGNPRSNDGDVRHALVERWGGKDKAIGKKAAPGPLYGVSSHAWQALAAGLYWLDTAAIRAADRPKTAASPQPAG